MSPSSIMMSPTLIPIRNAMRRSSGRASLRLLISRCNLDRASHCIHHARELDQETVADGFDDAAAVLGDPGVADFAPRCTQGRESALLILAHQPRIAGDIDPQYRR
jgi:hypothetical protein